MTLKDSRRGREADLLAILAPPIVLVRWRVAFRQFLGRAIARQYRTSVLGVLWAVMVPLITLAIYGFVFGTVMQSRWESAMTAAKTPIPYSLYLFAGLIVFWLMAQTLAEACNAIVHHTNLVKRAVFPLEIIPLTVVGTAVFHMLINVAILLAAMLLWVHELPLTALLFPLVLAPFLLLLAGVAWFLSALGVYFRDLSHIIGLTMTALLFLSPVFYATDRLSPRLQLLVKLNPVSFIVIEARAVLLEGRLPYWRGLLLYTAVAWLVAAIGLLFFRTTRRSFADVL